MPAYARYLVGHFICADVATVVGTLEARYARDGFATQYTEQTKAWERLVPLLQAEFRALLAENPDIAAWGLLLEYPLYRLRKRIDAVVLTAEAIIVLEVKVGAAAFHAADTRQVEEYALDLRDFHGESRNRPLVPVLWCTDAPQAKQTIVDLPDIVALVRRAGRGELQRVFHDYISSNLPTQHLIDVWDTASYHPVPNIIQAATSIFAGHDVRAIARADASNLAVSAKRIVSIIGGAKARSEKLLVFLTGVPGAGKTLAGLQVVHDALTTGTEERGDIVYLSGNTPLVVVLREALARDTVSRIRSAGGTTTFSNARRIVRTRIQHISDFLRQYLTGDQASLPHEHVIVFDEAQRAWDAKHGAEKFSRPKSEPSLLLEIMGRHTDWCVCVCLVGGGQEINTGEEGVKGWGDALRTLSKDQSGEWRVYGPDDVVDGGPSTGGFSLGEIPSTVPFLREPNLCLSVSLRSFRSPALSDWVTAVLSGDSSVARGHAQSLTEYPVVLTRSLERARSWLREVNRGERRYGMLASSGARRLRAHGVGIMLGAGDADAIAHWYLNDREDIRSSFCLEVPANEYACQGLEIDHGCVCWGGDLVRAEAGWRCRQLSGTSWNEVRTAEGQRYVKNTYRVLLTRSREGIVIWIPHGESSDRTRDPGELDGTAQFLIDSGVRLLDRS